MVLKHKKEKNIRQRQSRQQSNSSVSAYTYHNSRNELEENIERDKKRAGGELLVKEYWPKRLGFILLLVLTLLFLYKTLVLSTTPKIVFLGNINNSSLYQQYIPQFKNSSSKLFSSSIFNHNKITVNTNLINKTLTKEYPEFGGISVTLPALSSTPVVYVTPSDPAIILSNSEGNYLINENGIAMLYINKGSSEFKNLGIPEVVDQSGLKINLGQPALTSQNIQFIQTVIAQLKAKNYIATSMTLPVNSAELDVYIKNQSYHVKFNLQDNTPKLQSGSYLAVQNYLKGQSFQPTQYIDVRTQGRAYYQ